MITRWNMIFYSIFNILTVKSVLKCYHKTRYSAKIGCSPISTALFEDSFSPASGERVLSPPSLLGMWSSRSAEGRKSALAHKDEAYLGWLTVKHGRRTLRWRRRFAGGVDILLKSSSCPPHDLLGFESRRCVGPVPINQAQAQSVFQVLQLTFQERLHCCCFKAVTLLQTPHLFMMSLGCTLG